jgi:hypothetical protein
VASFEIKPVEGEAYEGRQWGYMVECDGQPILHATTGGTGDCWNIEAADDADDNDVIPMHVCDLNGFISALEALRDSRAHAEHVARWAA